MNTRPPTLRICGRPWRRWFARLSLGRLAGAASARGAVFILRAELVSDRGSRSAPERGPRGAFQPSRQPFRTSKTFGRSRSSPPRSRKARGAAKECRSRFRARTELEFFNGLGGFSDDGREYLTILGEGQWTPAPWINVIANSSFGFQTSVEGGGYTWSINSQQNQLTPWSNDPVTDRPGEVIYVRDEDNGALWTPTALPIREEAERYVVRHGQGYSRFEHVSNGISLELLQYVAPDDPIKISRLKIRNQSGRKRRLSITGYVEWALGASRDASAPFLVTEIDPETRVMFARNHWSTGSGSASPLRILAADSSPGPATGKNSSAATARSIVPLRLPAARA